MGRVLTELQANVLDKYVIVSEWLARLATKRSGYYREATYNQLSLNSQYEVEFNGAGTHTYYVYAPQDCVDVIFFGWYCGTPMGKFSKLRIYPDNNRRRYVSDSDISRLPTSWVYGKEHHYYVFNYPHVAILSDIIRADPYSARQGHYKVFNMIYLTKIVL